MIIFLFEMLVNSALREGKGKMREEKGNVAKWDDL
jgi:hypothetical protein